MKQNGVLKALVQTYYRVQKVRIQLSNQLSAYDRGATHGEGQDYHLYMNLLENQVDGLKEDEKQWEDLIKIEVNRYPIYVEWISQQKGAGHMMGGVLVSTFNIEIATTVSKMWQYSGMNPGIVRGWVPDGKDDKGVPKWKISDDMIRGDRLTPGYRCPFNKWLRTKLVGVLASGIIKAGGDYALKYYYPLHVPVSRREEMGFGRLDVEEGWKDKKEGHRSNAAKRYMIKMFLKDLYVAWRTLEGLEVRPPYSEEYLGKMHHGNTDAA